MMKDILTIIFTIGLVAVSYSQEHVVRGKIVDESDQSEPIIGGTVVEYDKDRRVVNGTVTNMNGEYIIEVSSENVTLSFSYIGYKTVDIETEGRSIIDIKLVPESIQMEEIVVTAEKRSTNPYSNISEKDRTGARASVDMSELSTAGIVSVDEALQGQISGLSIVSGGDPGSGGAIVIRGLGTLSSSQPLIVMDGIAQDVRISSDFDFASANLEDISELVNIAPQDIKSIEVLKDAAETAVWGSRGANGVLLIETLTGVKGETRFNYSVKLSQAHASPSIPMLSGDEYIMLQLEELHAPNGIYILPDELSGDPYLLGIDFYNYTRNTDWIGAVTTKGMALDHYFKVSGGGDKTQFFASINYLDESGTVINTGLQRISTRANLNFKLSDKLRLVTRFSLSSSDRRKNVRYANNTILSMAEKKAPHMSIWEYDGQGDRTGSYFIPENSYQGSGRTFFNPVALATLGYDDWMSNNIETTYDLNYMLHPKVKLSQTVTYTVVLSKQNQFYPESAIGLDWLNIDNNRNFEVNNAKTRLLLRSTASLGTFKVNNHTFSGTMVFETDQQIEKFTSLQNTLNSSELFTDPSSGGVFRWSSNESRIIRTMGLFSQVFYKYLDRYMFTANVRYDITSRLGENTRGALFPGFSAGWRFSEESFLHNLNFLGDSKLRISYGFNGNPTTAGSWDAYMERPVVIPNQIQLDNFGWEKIKQLNVGADINLFQDRLSILTDWYTKVTDNLVWTDFNIPSSSGFGNISFYNGGQLENRGWEVSVNASVYRKGNWNIRLNSNISHNENRFLSFPDNYNSVFSTELDNGEFPRRFNIGEPLGSFYGLLYDGVWSSTESVMAYDENGDVLKDVSGVPIPLSFNNSYFFAGGDARYRDINHDGVIDINDAVFIGDANPDYEGGVGANISYKNLNFNVNFYIRNGFDILNYRALETQGMNDRNNQSKAVLKRWRSEGDDFEGMLPRAYFNHPANNVGSDRYVEDGSFTRLNNISIKYEIPERLTKKFGIDRLNMGIDARRLITFTSYTGQNPEIPRDMRDPSWFGVDKGDTPPPVKVVLSIDINF